MKWINTAKYGLSTTFTFDFRLHETIGSNLTDFRFPGPQATPGIHLNTFGHKVFYAGNDLYLSQIPTYLHVYNIFLLPANLNRTDSLALVVTLLFWIYKHISVLVFLTFGAG